MKRTLLALIVLSLLLAPGGGESTAQLVGGSGGATGFVAQGAFFQVTCFGLYLAFHMACHDAHCAEHAFLWFSWEHCDEAALAECQGAAAAFFAECIGAQGS